MNANAISPTLGQINLSLEEAQSLIFAFYHSQQTRHDHLTFVPMFLEPKCIQFKIATIVTIWDMSTSLFFERR